MAELDPERRHLAQAFGVATEYYDWQGRHTIISPETISGVLAALGVDASSPEAAAHALVQRELAPWLRALPASRVLRQGQPVDVAVHLDRDADARLRLELESGEARELSLPAEPSASRQIENRDVDRYLLELPADLPLGYHTLTMTSDEHRSETRIIITPAWVGMPAGLGERRSWGLAAQLYSARSRASWGVGDLADLATLASWSGGDHGAGYILINPLHAAEPVPPMEPSPYLPTTRRFVNPIYIRVEAIEEYVELAAEHRARIDELRHRVIDDPQSWQRIERDPAWAAKREACRIVFAAPRSPARQGEFDTYTSAQGRGLTDFATWNVLAAAHGTDWTRWPPDLQHPRSEAVAAFAAEHAEDVVFECWLQWVIDEQLAAAQRAAQRAGMDLGVMKDLAVGVHPRGAETWAQHDVYARGVGVGAPPDAYNQNGQNWTQPPWRPDRLAELGYAPFRDLVATVLRNAGGVRVDHVVGLFRLWWIPEGMRPTEGTYVHYDHEAMVGILALEAYRAEAVVVGEDLGTVEPSARHYLRERGIFGTSILWFEGDWDGDGSPLQAHRWREYCLASVTTHDLPPTAAYLAGDHVRLRDRLGLLTRPVAEELEVAEQERAAWLQRLHEDGLLPSGPDGEDIDTQLEALHRFLVRTPAKLVNLALTDAVGDRRTQNQPGTTDEYPNWRVPLSGPDGQPLLVEDAMASPLAARLMNVFAGL